MDHEILKAAPDIVKGAGTEATIEKPKAKTRGSKSWVQ
jgi:hypothetical protein